jgi:signal transduction histidine kinase
MDLSSVLMNDKEMFMDHGFSDKGELMDMIKILSHDIRSPLITIAAGLKLLKKGAYGPAENSMTEELEKLYEIVIKTAGNMEDFMERAFSLDGDLSSPHEQLDLHSDIIEPLLNELRNELRCGSVSLENGINITGFYTTSGNRFLLKAVFRNLIRNALKYGEKGGEISIDIDERDSFYQINVFNSGIPVQMEQQKMLFKKFCRTGEKGNPDGMGLGLFLVREILQRHGCKIRYEAEEDGSNFIFTLPIYKKRISLERSFRARYMENNRVPSSLSLS